MINKIIEKYHINVYSMLKHGTVALVTMLGVAILFGIKNIIIAFPIALTSTVLSRQNIQIEIFSKLLKIILLDLIIIIVSFVSSQNIFIGIVINLISIFLIMYLLISPYDLTLYKPFLMLYVFTQYPNITLKELPFRILAVVFGILVIACSNVISKVNERSKLGNSITKSFLLVNKQLKNILNKSFEEDLVKQCSQIMRELAYRIYVTRYKKYLTTNLGKLQFELYINIEYFNLFLRKVYEDFNKNNITKYQIKQTINIIDKIISYSKNILSIEKLREDINCFTKEFKNNSKYMSELCDILLKLTKNFEEFEMLGNKEANKSYEKWEKSDFNNVKTIFNEFLLHKKNMRLNFALRMSISLTIVLFGGELLGFYKIIWAIITVMSVIQPYYEYTINNTKERILGNIIGILFTGTIINLVNIRLITILILIISIYLLYAFKEYYKISLFASIASICISSLSENINKLLLYRIFYVIIGAIIVILINKLLFPYKLKDGINEIVEKINKLNTILVNDSIDILNGSQDAYKIRDTIIHSTLLSEKLAIRNLNFNDEYINRVVNINNEFIIQVGYRVLRKTN